MNHDLMQAVLASADEDDDARLVYADWCEDEGDLARATFIRTQVERVRLSKWDVKQIELRVREEKLIADHGKAWFAEAPRLSGIEWTGFERGFPAVADVDSFGALCDARDAIAQSMPLARVTVPWPEGEAQATTAVAIPTLRAMRIERAVMDEEPGWLAASPLLSTITDLALVDGYAEDPGTSVLLASPYLRGLRKLELIRNEIGTQAVQALVAGEFPNLVDLSVEERGEEGESWSSWEGGLDLPAMEMLAEWPGLAGLRRLDLSGNRIPAAGFDALFQSRFLTSLESLLLEYTFTHAGRMPWRALAELPLREINVAYHSFNDADEDELAILEAPCFRSLQSLDLRGAVFSSRADLESLLRPVSDRLQALDFRGTDIDVWPQATDGAPVRALVGRDLPKLHTLKVEFYGKDDHVADLIAWADTDPMRWLHLTGSGLADAVPALEEASFPTLQRLELEGMNDASKARVLESPLGKRLHESGGLRFLEGRRRY